MKALIIFAKNPEAVRVKTRLAVTIGNEAALEVYESLMEHTRTIARQIDCARLVFLDGGVSEGNSWDINNFQMYAQMGNDLGERMSNAFDECFNRGFGKVLILGTDCPELTREIIKDAFKCLESSDYVIGPATDGGYYLLGMKQASPWLFQGMTWSHDSVCDETINRTRNKGFTLALLPTLSDIDTEADYLSYIAAQGSRP